MNLDAVLRIVARVTGEDSVKRLQGTLTGVVGTAEQAKRSFRDIGGSAVWQAAAIGATAVLTGLTLATRQAITFESSLADVRKVVDGLDTPAGMVRLREEIFALSRELPISAQGFAQMYAAAGAAGVARNELQQFASDVAKVAIAFDLTAEEAGTAMAKLRANLSLAQPELMLLADAINTLSNSFPATAREITEFALRTATAGKAVGLTAQETVAFGAAMIASGAQSEVAATSFNNMVKALTRGASMTERQVSALVKLGYAQDVTAAKERELTQAVERESRDRLDAIERESDAVLKEIRRRYDEIRRITDESFDDEALAWQRAQEDRYDVLFKQLQRQRQAELDANQEASRAVLDAIEDRYDRQMTMLRRQQEDEQRVYDRQQERRRTQVEAQQQDLEEIEVSGAEARFDAIKKVEEQRRAEQLAEAKKTAAALGAAMAGPEMAKAMQRDAVGTIRDVFDRIRKLPEEMQLSVVSDLFGDEARALLPLIKNAELLDRALGLVAKQQNYAGSTAKEFASRAATTANQLQLARNRFDELAITAGEKLVPALVLALRVLEPVLSVFLKLAQIPVLGDAIVLLTTALSGLVLLAPALGAFTKLLPLLAAGLKAVLAVGNVGGLIAGWGAALVVGLQGVGAAIGATIAGWAGIIGPAMAALGTFFAKAIAVIGSILSGPVGWALLAVGLITVIAVFREQIGGFFAGLWDLIGPPLAATWSTLKGWLTERFAAAGELFKPLIDAWTAVWGQLSQIAQFSLNTIAGIVRWWAQASIAILYQIFVQPWVNIWNGALRQPVMAFVNWIGGAWSGISQSFEANVVRPIQGLWADMVAWLRSRAGDIGEAFRSGWAGVTTWFQSNVLTPLQRGWEALMTAIPRAINQAGAAIRSFWTGIINNLRSIINGFLRAVVNAFNSVANLVNRAISAFNALPGPDIPLVPRVTAPAFAEGGFVDRPTLAQVAEAGEGEYIIPESKMAKAAANYLGGARGAAVIPTNGGTVTAAGGSPVINITTGPVLEFDGRRYVTLSDFERGMRATAEGVLGRLRTPAARVALRGAG